MKISLVSPVTLFHYDEQKEEEIIHFFPNAKVHGTTKIGDLSHGRRSQNQYTVRLFTQGKIDVSCGDEVFSEYFGKRLTVVGFSDNRRGSKKVHHIKLIVK